ncbi:MAG: DUF3667 domain-containing protein [Croceitalea sp.]|nr:DUF3667 domain-containing protein [Croceitalea sp.]MBT8238041.1 DUF3667 domain-containing protein [Croceitalea sp.]NNL08527.1 DUF3667 domain-containing protein [Croceitalea sp.]
MNCKNCNHSLRTDFGYCPVCGAKVIKNRLTLKHLWQDLSFQVFNLDNTLLKTIKHLMIRPEVVIESFITGARKKYMNPISFFAIAITLSGIMFFILRNVYEVNLSENSFSTAQTPNMDFVFDYQGVLSYLIMPIYALMTWLLFLDIKKLNFTEHLVANAYTTGMVSFVQVTICLPLFGLFEIRYDIFNWIFLFFSICYQFYAFGRVHKTKLGSTILRGMGYAFLMLFVFMGMGIVIFLIAFLTGQVNLADFAPQ